MIKLYASILCYDFEERLERSLTMQTRINFDICA